MKDMTKKTALIAGATGVVGRNLLAHLEANPAWNVIAVSRTPPPTPGRYSHIAIDLLNQQDCRSKAHLLSEVTHVFHAAYVERGDSTVWVNDNTAMLINLIQALEPVAKHLQHVHVVHGTKWYGNHLGAFKTPAKEDDPRHMPPNFYYNQWDWLLEQSAVASWTCSSARPHAICGFGIGSPMNLPLVIAVYAVISRELGLPLQHPGTPGNWHALYQATDAALLAKAIIWMATDARCANQAFNITNGDLIRWENLWSQIADYWGMRLGPRRHINLTRMMSDKAPVWNRIVQRYDLLPHRYEDIVSWPYGDFVFTPEFDIISDTSKCRRYGFHEVADTEQMFFNLWDKYRQAKILPD
jgi:nucleoside-diphosphate-sugar epimerase